MTNNDIAEKVVELEIADYATLEPIQLEEMHAAGQEIRECYRVLKKGGMNIVGEILRGQGKFYEMNHYPAGDVFDPETFSQYYYHSHRGKGEHGHFHTFLRAGGMQEGVTPVPYYGKETWPAGDEALSHLIAISMDEYGFPVSLFAVNRWVTAETWYVAEDVLNMLPRFNIDHAYLSWPVNRWLTAMLRLFRPQIEGLALHRDLMINAWQEQFPEVDVFEDRRLEITSEIEISVEGQMEEIEAALAQ